MTNEVFLVEAIIPFTGHSVRFIVVAKDTAEAEEFVKTRFRHGPLGDVSGVIVPQSKMIDRSKAGVLETEQ
jgi:hypothetical protein